MLRTATIFLACVFALLLTPAQAQRGGDWVPLGEQRVGFGVDRDVINIGQSEEWFRDRAFRALRFEAEGNDVHMMSIRLVYLNGHTEDLRIDRLVRRGAQLPVDLRGDRSYLKQIEMTYRSRPSFTGQAVIKVFGQAAGRRGGESSQRPDLDDADRGLVLLGEQRVGFEVDRDVINIAQAEDWYRNRSFKSLRFQADGNDVHLMAIRIVYLNGHAEDLRVDQRIRAGAQLKVDLRGERSYLKQIEMTYRARRGFAGRATVKVYGEPARRRDQPGERRDDRRR